MLAAYGPVALLAATAVVTRWRRDYSFTRVQRLLLIWAPFRSHLPSMTC
jgi:hypothetical protein